MIETLQPRQVFNWYDRKEKKRLYRADKAAIIEDYVANKMDIYKLSKKYLLQKDVIETIVTLYFKKPEISMTIMSKI